MIEFKCITSTLTRAAARRPDLAFALLAAAAAATGAACRVDPAEFYDRVYRCDTAATDPGCGTGRDGRPLTCFGARQLGAADDFCARTCDVPRAADATATVQDDSVCLTSGIELPACRPSDDGRPDVHPGGACGRPELGCFRTDLLADEGVCTTMNPCSEDGDCLDNSRSVCASTFLADIYAQAPQLQRDHMFCLQTGCRAQRSSCPPGETCLQEVIAAGARPPDICVPNCDADLRCPPNFLCYRKVSTPVAPKVCIPGLLGFTCEHAIDCLVGECVDNGAGYKVCTTRCDDDAGCRTFDGAQGTFVCVKNPANPSAPGYCQTPDAYRGSICLSTADCARNADEICTWLDPGAPTGVCLLPCPQDGRCPERGGIPHTCLPPDAGGQRVCFPGYFGLPCAGAGDEGCVGDLGCHPADGAGAPGAPAICTRPCAAAADCRDDRWIGGAAWCGSGGVCLPRLGDGEVCARAEACRSGRCVEVVTAGGVQMRCASAAGSGL